MGEPAAQKGRLQNPGGHRVGINLNSRIIADTRLAGISGAKLAGGFLLRLTIDFNVMGWELPDIPVVVFAPARVHLQEMHGLLLGQASPETLQPFTVSNYGGPRAAMFDLFLTPQAMDVLEKHRDGRGVPLSIQLQGEIRRAGAVHLIQDEVRGELNVVQWLAALEQAGYGRSMLFEVPIPSTPASAGAAVELLEAARQLFSRGHYPDAVAKCRMVIEGLTASLGQDAELRAATAAPKHTRTREQRELAMRQAAMDFASLAHHPTSVAQDELFDRNAAQMLLGTTAALVSSALAKK
ncbi:hypothetical protein SNE35_09800 [Paucibacter sp. R3-3]|uniref:Uncharacterized protein n=1 Tax=Roseateles agri TaxID=3098619 RepID=A0ABU5DEV5_9BURK|nr:hypothetical protein [Paucibacter sp. R3-3]MDY0744802.1 hypothetical protein [Paucibacter sp. R3-3]